MRIGTLTSIGATTLASAALGLAPTAVADVVTVEPGAGDARTFAASAGGWTSAHTGFCVTPLVCASAASAHVPTGGTGGPGDGFLRTDVTGLLAAASTASATWTSPVLRAPAGTDTATLSATVRTNAGALSGIGAADLDLIIRDDTAATDTVVDDDIPLTGPAADGWRVRRPAVPASALTPGHDLRIVVRLRLEAPLAVVPVARVDVDDVALTMVDAAAPAGTDPMTTEPAGDGTGDVLVGGGLTGGSDAAPAPRRLTPAAPAAPTLSAMLRACYGGDLALTYVQREGRRVRMRGLSALPAGTRVALRDERGRTVATAKLGRDGRFAATAPAPPAARRARTAYTAVAGRTRSRTLRLVRATSLDALTAKGSTVTVKGRVDLRRVGRKPSFVLTGGRGPAACGAGATRLAVQGRVAFDRRTGAYRLRVTVPAGAGRAVVRAAVRGRIRSASLFGLV